MMRCLFFGLFLVLAYDPAGAATLTPGHLLATVGDQLYELTSAGTTVQKITVPANGEGSTEPIRDLTLDAALRVQIFRGLTNPALSTWDPGQNAWMHSSFAGWSTSDEATSPGGIAPFGRDLFAIDMQTEGAGSARGLVRFAGADGYSATRFATAYEYIDVTLGHDFRLYALRADQHNLDIYDPASHALLTTVTLAKAIRALAADRQVRIFGAAWNGQLYRFAANGSVEASLVSGIAQLIDIDLARDGRLAAGARGGKIVLTNSAFSSPRVINIPGADATFITFVETPLPPEVHQGGFEEGHVGGWSKWIDEQ